MDIITRKEALAQGLTTYFTGKPCKYGHIEPRDVLRRHCIVCKVERQKLGVAGSFRNGAWVRLASASCKADLSFVYAYLRAKDTKHGPKGSPYYIGVGSNTVRPTQPHRVGCVDLVPPCSDQIVVLRSFVARDKALEWETFYIDRYGLISEGGILRNQTRNPGGVGKGYRWDRAVVEQRAETVMRKTAQRYGVAYEDLKDLTRGQRNILRLRYLSGLRGEALLIHPPRRKGTTAQARAAREKQVAFCRRWGIADVDKWISFSKNQRSTVNMRLKAGWDPEEAMNAQIMADNAGRSKAKKICDRWQLGSIDDWLALDSGFRKVVLSRLASGWDKERALSEPVRTMRPFRRAKLAA